MTQSRSTNVRTWFPMLAMAFVLLPGCGTYRMAGLEDNPYGASAMMTLPSPVMYSGIYITHIDCKSRGVGLYKRYELVPGWRVITFAGNDQLYVPPNPKSYLFKALPGAMYTFERNYKHRSDDWILDILDQESNQPIESEWYWANWSYWSGAEPDPTMCEVAASMNATEQAHEVATGN